MKLVSAVASISALLLGSTALASDANLPSAEQVLNSLAVYHQTDTSRFRVGPRWSEQYGWAIDARGGMMLSEALAVGLVVTYGENDRELVVNTGLQLDDTTIIIGTIAGHQQNVPVGDDREWVDQLEGGLSLRSDDGVGFIGGYEANIYATRSSTDGSLATATMYGAEYNMLLHPIEGMTARLGAGYEKITWDDGSDPTEGWTANLNVTQKVGDTLSLKLGVDLGQSEDRYTAGTEFLLAHDSSSNSRLGLEYSYIVDKDGGDDDYRLTAYWRMGFGESGTTTASSAMGYAGEAALAGDSGHDHDRILTAVMEKPDYLPTNVLSKSGRAGSGQCSDTNSQNVFAYANNFFYFLVSYIEENYPAARELFDEVANDNSRRSSVVVVNGRYYESDYRIEKYYDGGSEGFPAGWYYEVLAFDVDFDEGDSVKFQVETESGSYTACGLALPEFE